MRTSKRLVALAATLALSAGAMIVVAAPSAMAATANAKYLYNGTNVRSAPSTSAASLGHGQRDHSVTHYRYVTGGYYNYTVSQGPTSSNLWSQHRNNSTRTNGYSGAHIMLIY